VDTPASFDTAPPRPGDSYVQSFARGLAVIRAFNAEAPSQTLSEVAQRTGLTRAGARRILLTLEQLGYVEALGRQFRLTAKILDLGFAYLSSQPMWNLAEPVMQALVADVNESCSAAVLDGDDIVYVLRVPTRQIVGINLGIGSRLPAYCTSMGRVLLAGLPADELRLRIAASPQRRAWTSRTITQPMALLREIEAVRAQRWSLVDQELEQGLVSLAAPIIDRGGRTIAALNVSGQASRTPAALMTERVLPRLLDAAAQISQLVRMKA
jgi:IclR family transcriptional regulator, pca regulon regulatory protein